MDSAREAAAVSDAVISPSLWATLKEPLPGWLCLGIQFELGVGEAFKGPFVENFKPSDEMEQLLVQASQHLEGLKPETTSRVDAAVSGTIDDLLGGLKPETTAAIDDLMLQASQQFERSSVVPEKLVNNATRSRFLDPVTIGDVENVRVSGVPGKTRAQTSWGTGVWAEWVRAHMKLSAADEEESGHFSQSFVLCLLTA